MINAHISLRTRVSLKGIISSPLYASFILHDPSVNHAPFPCSIRLLPGLAGTTSTLRISSSSDVALELVHSSVAARLEEASRASSFFPGWSFKLVTVPSVSKEE